VLPSILHRMVLPEARSTKGRILRLAIYILATVVIPNQVPREVRNVTTEDSRDESASKKS